MNWRLAIVPVMLLCLLLTSAASASMSNYRLNGELPEGGDVDDDFQISPDGERVVYLAEQDDADVQELYSVPIGGGDSTKLNSALVVNGDVNRFAISPDSQRVVYRADQDTSGADELYSVGLAGGAVTKLNAPLTPGSRVLSFRISSDNEAVVYCADHQADGELAYHSVPLGGGATMRLSHSLLGDEMLGNSQISPDGETVVYWIQVYFGPDSLYSVPIGGGAPVLLGSDDHILEYEIDATSTYAVYRTQTTEMDNHLYSSPLGGGTPVQLDAPTEADPYIENFQISPDGARVVYAGKQTGYSELFSVPTGGGTPVKLSLGIQQVAPLTVKAEYAISPDSEWVVYGTDASHLAYIGYYRVAIAGGMPVALVTQSSYDGSEIQISPDGAWVVYAALANPKRFLRSVPLAGGPANGLDNSSNISTIHIRPDSGSVVYLGRPSSSQYQIYSVPIGGGLPEALNPVLPEGASVSLDFEISPDGQTVVYHADQESVDVLELWATRAEPGVDLSIHKVASPDETVASGQPLTYTLAYTNGGQLTATGVVISDVLPAGITDPGYGSVGATITPVAGITYAWQVQDLDPGEGGTITIAGIAGPSLLDGTALVNTVQIGGDGPDANPLDNTDRVTTTVSAGPPDGEFWIYLPLLFAGA